MITPRTLSLLNKEGLSEYVPLLEQAGFRSVSELADGLVTEADLERIGIARMFHRKRLLRLAAPQGRSNDSANNASGSVSEARRRTGGDCVVVEVFAAKSVDAARPLSEREHYVKVCLCDFVEETIYPKHDSTFRTPLVRGPAPDFGTRLLSDGTPASLFRICTNFQSHCVSLELKENRRLGENLHLGAIVLSPSYFLQFGSDTVVHDWFPLHVLGRAKRRAAESDDSPHGVPRAALLVKFLVPGGAPRHIHKAMHVAAVNMDWRKLRVTVFDAAIVSSGGGKEFFTAPPATYVTIHLDVDENIKKSTRVVAVSYNPNFDETLEFFGEVANAKLLIVKLKCQVPRTIGSSTESIGVVHIPIQYFLSCSDTTDIDSVYTARDEEQPAVIRAQIHLRIEVRERNEAE